MSMILESMIVLYDPDDEGYLEIIERDLDKIIIERTMTKQTYFVLLVFSRFMNKEKDKDLRFKIAALADATP